MEACFHKYLCLYLYCAKHRQRDEAKRNRAGAAHASGDSTDVKMAALRVMLENRDNFTCCNCGNSTHMEPNLLLEIDHIIPVAKGGCTVEDNIQTLCWKCNRSKSDKIIV